jgi:hypothetical protein
MRFRFSFALLAVLLLRAPDWGRGVIPQSGSKSDGDPSHSKLALIKVPTGVILVKGAWSSASDSITPVPEGGRVTNGVFSDPYFELTYALPANWIEKYKGPPPSDSGLYVLAQLSPGSNFKGFARASILITAQDMFFTPMSANNAAELINYMKYNLQAEYQVEVLPTPTKIAGHSFVLFAYWSPVAQLHWYVLATQIRCHAVQIVLTSRDTKVLRDFITEMRDMKLPSEADPTKGASGGAFPVCIEGYARDENMIGRVNPIFTEHRFNSVPVRIIIDKEGKVKHIHVLSAFPDQAKVITDALAQWTFKRYRRDGVPLEVETGILFGPAAATTAPRRVGAIE